MNKCFRDTDKIVDEAVFRDLKVIRIVHLSLSVKRPFIYLLHSIPATFFCLVMYAVTYYRVL